MNILIIGGTGTISLSLSKALLAEGHALYLINRGNQNHGLQGDLHLIQSEIDDEQNIKNKIAGLRFDAVIDFLSFVPAHIERAFRLFQGQTKQYVFISSASVCQKPLNHYLVSETTPMKNPYGEYSRNKIACEEFALRLYRDSDFPVTIIRPSHTYDDRTIPVGVHGANGFWQVIQRMLDNKPVIMHGDGTSLWTLTHSEDFARAAMGLLCNPLAIGEVVQITADAPLTWNQIYSMIADALGVLFKPYYVSSDFLGACGGQYDFYGALLGDKANTIVFDNSKLKQFVPEFQAKIPFSQGAKRAVQYVLQHKELQKADPDFDRWCDSVIAALETAKRELTESR